MELILASIFSFIILYVLLKAFRSEDPSAMFSPLVFISFYFLYYLIAPFFLSSADPYGGDSSRGVARLFWGGIINMGGILAGFYFYRPRRVLSSNYMYTEYNATPLAIRLALIGFLCYAAVYGFSFQFASVQTDFYDATGQRFGHTDEYITMLISLLPAAACLFYAGKAPKAYNIILFIVATIIGIMYGSRYKILMFYFPFIVFYHLYPEPKKINYKFWIPAALLFITAMGVVEKTRNYRSGLDLTTLMALSQDNVSSLQASEGELVFYFSAKAMDAYKDEEPLVLDVLGTAICLPIPRAIFPEKPDAQYLRDGNVKVLGTDVYGAAWCNITEAYVAFGWLGVFLNGLFIGLLARFFWNNYQEHSDSIGAVLYLSLFNAICYVFISRGYLAQELLVFMYYLPVIYWVCWLLLNLTRKEPAIYRRDENFKS